METISMILAILGELAILVIGSYLRDVAQVVFMIIGSILVFSVTLALALVDKNKKAKKELEAEKSTIEEMNKKLEEDQRKLTKRENALQEKRQKLNDEIKDERQKLKDEIKEERQKLNTEIEEERRKLDDEIAAHTCKVSALENELAELDSRLDKVKADLLIAETTVFENEDTITSEEYKDKIAVLRIEYKDFVKTGSAVIQTNPSIYDGAKKRLNDNIKQMLRCFNSESSSILAVVSATNIEKQRSALAKSYETINTIFATDGLQLNRQLLEYRLKELNLLYTYQEKKALEQEEQKAIRAQMLEEEKVRREIEREKAKVEKEETQFKNEVDKLMKYLAKADDDVQKQLYVDKIKELEGKIKLLEKDKENILQREQNTRAGFVYIISNIGSFGEDIYKIGMTRRLEPMERIDELGSASVPFPFDVHAMIFSEDAPTLETTLHNTFRANQVNLVNPRKEFYNVPLSEIERVVKENYNATVTFTQIAEAAQYRESVKLRQENNACVPELPVDNGEDEELEM